jgi:hypothetical protein
MEQQDKYIPLDKSWLTRVGVLDIINGYADIEKFIDSQQNTNDDILAIGNASAAWRSGQSVNVGESATLYRLLQFACWKLNLRKVFIVEGSLRDRKITNNESIVNLSQTELLKLDNGTTQWATASVICGDKERMSNPPVKLQETYDAVRHWQAQRQKGLCWESKYDATIERQARVFLDLKGDKKVRYIPLCSDDYCFARVFSFNPLNIEKLMQAIPSQWLVYYDISHLQLFYFAHIFKFPKLDNFFFGGSTHKTFPGPQKSIILLNNKELFSLVDAEFIKNTSSVHTGSLLALLITVLEMEKFGKIYARDILKKTKVFAKLLSKEFNVIGPLPNLTNTHQVCVDVPDILEITQKLASIGIITTPMRIPSKNTRGLRFGLQELCRLGLEDKDLQILADIIIACVKGKQESNNLREKVKKLAKKLDTTRYILSRDYF